MAHLETRKSTIFADSTRIKGEIEHLSAILEKRTYDDITASKQLEETEKIANLLRNRHQDSVAVNHAANQAVMLTETEGQD